MQIDDADLGGKKPKKVGRGAVNKIPFVISVAPRKNNPIDAHLRCVPGFTEEAIKGYAQNNIAAGSRVLSDGLGCFNGLADAGLKHKAVLTRSGRPEDERFKWTNMGFGDIKTAITGTCRSCDPQRALSCSLRMALQPPLRAQKKNVRCSDRAHTLPIDSCSQNKSGDVEVIRIPFGIAAFLAQIRLEPGVRFVTLPLNAG